MFSQASVCPRGRVCAMGFGVGMCMEVGTHPPPRNRVWWGVGTRPQY